MHDSTTPWHDVPHAAVEIVRSKSAKVSRDGQPPRSRNRRRTYLRSVVATPCRSRQWRRNQRQPKTAASEAEPTHSETVRSEAAATIRFGARQRAPADLSLDLIAARRAKQSSGDVTVNTLVSSFESIGKDAKHRGVAKPKPQVCLRAFPVFVMPKLFSSAHTTHSGETT